MSDTTTKKCECELELTHAGHLDNPNDPNHTWTATLTMEDYKSMCVGQVIEDLKVACTEYSQVVATCSTPGNLHYTPDDRKIKIASVTNLLLDIRQRLGSAKFVLHCDHYFLFGSIATSEVQGDHFTFTSARSVVTFPNDYRKFYEEARKFLTRNPTPLAVPDKHAIVDALQHPLDPIAPPVFLAFLNWGTAYYSRVFEKRLWFVQRIGDLFCATKHFRLLQAIDDEPWMFKPVESKTPISPKTNLGLPPSRPPGPMPETQPVQSLKRPREEGNDDVNHGRYKRPITFLPLYEYKDKPKHHRKPRVNLTVSVKS